jgi:predicted nucleotidyltransferase
VVHRKYKVKSIIEEFIRVLVKKIPVERAILFGSYVYGKPRFNSDIDIAIISSKFKRMDEIKRIMFLSDIARKIDTPKDICLDPLGFTLEELENADYFDIATEIKEKGEIIYPVEQVSKCLRRS